MHIYIYIYIVYIHSHIHACCKYIVVYMIYINVPAHIRNPLLLYYHCILGCRNQTGMGFPCTVLETAQYPYMFVMCRYSLIVMYIHIHTYRYRCTSKIHLCSMHENQRITCTNHKSTHDAYRQDLQRADSVQIPVYRSSWDGTCVECTDSGSLPECFFLKLKCICASIASIHLHKDKGHSSVYMNILYMS
jgi:hypothetical protein